MQIEKINLIYFSATYTTRKVALSVVHEINAHVQEYDITQQELQEELSFTGNEILVLAMPVYFGRIPALAVNSLKKIKGHDTPAILLAVYGNRAFDDALLEMKDIIVPNGFHPISAGAFIARHSIFPEVATTRPDEKDLEEAGAFGKKNAILLSKLSSIEDIHDLQLPGNRPYHPIGKIPFFPTGNENCKECGECVSQCPTKAINKDNPRETDPEKCIACGRCIVVCTKDARHFSGPMYEGAKNGFIQNFSARKDIETFFI